jgi:protein-S-isoprenylcysteine O-methyltransferase Ste14
VVIVDLLFAALWIVFILFWVVSAINTKPTIGGSWVWWREIGVRLVIFILVVLALRVSKVRHAFKMTGPHLSNTNVLLGIVGLVLCACGVGLAIWARIHLGRDWGLPMSRRADPTLVMTGPYAFVRHPIYTGIILATCGSAIGVNIIWVPVLVVVGIYFIYSATREEKLLTQEFPQDYPVYMKRTKMLLPFIF